MRPLRLEAAAGFEQLRDDWSALAERSGNLFSTWEWAATWWRHQAAGREPLLQVCRDAEGRPAAILPLYRAFDRPVRVVRFIGHGPADQLGPVCAPGEPGVTAALAESAAGLDWDVLLADRLPAGGELARAGRRLLHESSPTIDIAGLDWESYLAQRSSNFRSQVRRKERKLIRDHGMAYRLSDTPDRLEQDMESLFALHRARWAHEGSGALEGTRERFHRDFAALALERGWLRLWFAEVDGEPIAAWYGFRFGGADWYYQFGRDPKWDKSSVGVVLLAHTVRDAIEAGQDEYKLLRGGEGYKDRFATADAGLETIALASGWRGALAISGARAGLALPDPFRGRMTRVGA